MPGMVGQHHLLLTSHPAWPALKKFSHAHKLTFLQKELFLSSMDATEYMRQVAHYPARTDYFISNKP